LAALFSCAICPKGGEHVTGADRKLLALGMKAAKFTAEELEKLIETFLVMVKNGLVQPQEKTYEDFQHPGGVSLLNVSVDEREMQGFSDIARKNGVNVSVKRNQEADTYYLCLQGKRDHIEKTLSDYRKQMQERSRTQARSLAFQLEQAKRRVAAYESQEKNKALERERSAGRE